jgi:hypothetical protein
MHNILLDRDGGFGHICQPLVLGLLQLLSRHVYLRLQGAQLRKCLFSLLGELLVVIQNWYQLKHLRVLQLQSL